jgi:hypothetical protein
MARSVFLWESLLLGVFGSVASVVVGAMAAGVLNSANVHLPLSVQLFLMSDTFELSDLPSALGGAIALIAIATGVYALAPRGFRIRSRPREPKCAHTRASRTRAGAGLDFRSASLQLACAGTRPRPEAGVSVCGTVRACSMGAKASR